MWMNVIFKKISIVIHNKGTMNFFLAKLMAKLENMCEMMSLYIPDWFQPCDIHASDSGFCMCTCLRVCMHTCVVCVCVYDIDVQIVDEHASDTFSLLFVQM